MNSPWGREQWLTRDPEEWSSFPGKYVMAGDERSRRGRAEPTARPRAGERPFDMWLQKQLHAMYDEIASEPLPNDLLGLIDNDAAKTGKKKGEADKGNGNKK